jgi:hypothetical protein
VRGRKLELEHFLGQHDVDICLLSETWLSPSKAFRLANYVCHRTDRPTPGGGTAILVRRGIVHHSVPVPGLTHLEATAIQTALAGKPVIILAAYLSPCRPLIGADLDACFGGGLPVLLAGDLNAKHVDWNSRLTTRRGKLLRDYADVNSCLIFGPDTPTTNPYNPTATPDVLDIVVTRDLHSPVHLASCSALSSDHLPVLIDTMCRSSFHTPPARSDFKRTDWSKFQTHLEAETPFDPELLDGMAIDTCVENFSGAVLRALADSTPKCRPRDDPRPPIPAGIQDEIRLKNRLRRQWQVTRDPVLKAEVNRLQRSVTIRLNEWRNDQWGATLESLTPEDQSLWKMTKRVMRIATPSPPLVTPGGFALSDPEKAEAVADSLEDQFQPVTDHSVPAVIEKVDVVLESYFQTPASEPHLTNPDEVQAALRGLKPAKAPGPNGIPNRALKHLPMRAVLLLVHIFNAVLRTHHYPTGWKHARVISILKPGKDPAQPTSYRPISLLDTIGKVFEKILLARILHEVGERGLLRDEQFGFRPKHSTSMQLARLVDRIKRNFGEKRLTGAVFLDVAKAFDTVWIEGLLYKLTLLNFPSYLVHTISSYLRGRTFEASFLTATSSRRVMRAGVAQGGLISPVLFSLYVNDMPTPSRHVELALYADDTAVIATSKKPNLLVSYLESYLRDLQRWLSEWRISINVSKSSAIIFARAGRRYNQPPPVTLFGEPIEWVDTTRYLGVTLDSRLTWSPHVTQVGKRTAQRMGLLGPVLNRRSELSIRNGVLLYKQLIRPLMDYACPVWRSAARTHVRRLQVLQSKCLRLVTGAPWYISNRQIHEDLGVPLFTDHVRALTASFDTRLPDVRNPLVQQLGRYIRCPSKL